MSRIGFRRSIAHAVLPWLLSAAAAGLAVAADRPAAPPQPLSTEEVGRPLTLEDAIAGALAKNEGILIERTSVDSADASVEGAKGAYDPLLAVDLGWRSMTLPVNSAFSGAPEGELAPTDRNAGATASLEQLLPTGGRVAVSADSFRDTTDDAFALLSPAYQTRLGLELRQPLLRDRAIDAARVAVRVAAADREEAGESLQREVADTVAAVERAYWLVVATRRAIGVQEDAVDLASQQLEETDARIESGAAPETEAAQPRAELERRRGDLLATLEVASRAENVLKELILGDDPAAWAERLEPVDEIAIEPETVDIAESMDRALESRPEIQAAEAFAKRRRAEAAFARNQVQPALDLVLGYDRFGLAGTANPEGSGIPGLPGEVPPELDGGYSDALGQLGEGDFDDARIALQLAVPIGNRTARAAARVADNAEVQAEAEVRRLRKAIRAEVLDAAAATATAGARIDAARASREAAEVQLAAETERFQAGLSTNFLVLTRQNDLAAARLDEIEALSDYRIALTAMSRATGSLLDERRIVID